MAVNINLKLNADDSGVKKKLADLAKMAKKGLTFGGKDGNPSSSGKPSEFSKFEKAMNRLSKAIEKETKEIEKQGKARYAWEKAKFVGNQVGRFGGAAVEGIHTGDSLTTRATSGAGEYASGGFMNSVHDKISAGQEIVQRGKDNYKSIKEAYKGKEEVKDENGIVTQKAQKGGVAAAMLKGLPMIGGVIGSLVGGMMKQVDDMGKEWTSVMASQQGTIGATKSYITGGGGHFQNSEMANAQIALRRTQGEFGFDAKGQKNIGISGRDTQFASQQNIGIGQYAEQLGQLKENDAKISTDFLRGAADINKMTGLKQGQFVAKLAVYSNMLKESGAKTGNIRQFAQLTGGLAKAGGLTGERAATVGQAIDQGVRKGFEGGAISTLIVGELARTMKMSIPRAQAYLEENGMANDKVRGAANKVSNRFMTNERSQDVGAMMFSQEGFMTKSEFYRMSQKNKGGDLFRPAEIKNAGGIDVGSNTSLLRKNERDEFIAGSKVFEESARLGYEASKRNLEILEKIAPGFQKIVTIMEQFEDKIFDGIDGIISAIEKSKKVAEVILN